MEVNQARTLKNELEKKIALVLAELVSDYQEVTALQVSDVTIHFVESNSIRGDKKSHVSGVTVSLEI